MNVLITGAAGTIGTVLRAGLQERREIVGVDRTPAPNVVALDILRDRKAFEDLCRGAAAIVHLAWDTREGGTALEPAIPENKQLLEAVLKTALAAKVGRVILASSVHVAFGYLDYVHGPEIVKDHRRLHALAKITVNDPPWPLGVYGASKVYMEGLGRAYSSRGLGVVAARFGNVTPDDGFGEYPFWLSHRDCCRFVEKCLTATNLPAFVQFFGVSQNACNPFDLASASRLLGYEPADGASCPEGLPPG